MTETSAADFQRLVLQKMTEDDFLQLVTSLASALRWRWCHFRPARTARGWRTPLQGSPGFPDLVMVRSPRLILAELKVGRGKLSPAQQDWITALSLGPDTGQAPREIYVWRPTDWDEIARILGAGPEAGTIAP